MLKYIETSSWHLFPIGTKTKEEKLKLQEYLDGKGIQTRLFYEKSLPQEKPCMHFEGEVEKANHFADTTFTLPMHSFLTDEEINYVAEQIKAFYN
jgi:dTDP-4-amino-4,6-dideoxygalactose transaminase